MSLFDQIENIAKNQSDLSLAHLEKYYSVPLKVFPAQQNIHSKVYGKTAEKTKTVPINIIGIVVGDDFFPADNNNIGTFQSGFLYTTSTVPKTGSTLEIQRKDGKIRNYKIEAPVSYGTGDKVFTRFRLSAIGR